MKKDFETNSYYLGLVQNIFAGSNGCFVAYMQFFYQFLVSKQKYVDFADCFWFLCSKEIKNCEILGECLQKMGGDPQYFSSSRKFMSAKSINYVKSIEKIFYADIELLEINIINLKSTIYKIEDEKLKENLRQVLNNKKTALRMLKEKFFKNKMLK